MFIVRSTSQARISSTIFRTVDEEEEQPEGMKKDQRRTGIALAMLLAVTVRILALTEDDLAHFL